MKKLLALSVLVLTVFGSTLGPAIAQEDGSESIPAARTSSRNGGEIIRDTEDPSLWRVYWMGEITFRKFPCRVTAHSYLNQLRQGKRRPEQPIQ